MGFDESCYSVLRKVPEGKVVTYKDLAKAIGSKGYRAVGRAMNKNPYSDVPCHRVVRSDGHVGGYVLGIRKKIEILKKEGVVVLNKKIDLTRFRFKL